MKILITGGLNAFAQRVARIFPPGYEIMFGDTAIPQVLLKNGKYVEIPKNNATTFNHELLKLALHLDIDLIIPLMKDEIIHLAESKTLFAEYGVQVAVPSLEVLKTVDFILNPGKELFPVVILNGRSVGQNEEEITTSDQSGVCLLSDSGEDILFCCLG